MLDVLPSIVWSCRDYVDHDYGRALRSSKGLEACRRCSLQPELMFHASLTRTSNRHGSEGSASYSLQAVHAVAVDDHDKIQVKHPVLARRCCHQQQTTVTAATWHMPEIYSVRMLKSSWMVRIEAVLLLVADNQYTTTDSARFSGNASPVQHQPAASTTSNTRVSRLDNYSRCSDFWMSYSSVTVDHMCMRECSVPQACLQGTCVAVLGQRSDSAAYSCIICREDAVALAEVQQLMQQIGFTEQDLRAAAIRCGCCRSTALLHGATVVS